MHDDHMILRRTAISPEHLGCPIRGCTTTVEVPAIPVVPDEIAGAFWDIQPDHDLDARGHGCLSRGRSDASAPV
jgi:hypothetical protein